MERIINTVGDLFNIFDSDEFLQFASFEKDPDRIGKTPRYGRVFGTWFRGQSDSSWLLEPSIFRSDADIDEGLTYWVLRLDSAENRATCRTTFDWLCLMRHHRLPTRLLDWSETGHVLDVNPAHAVRGPKYVVKKGKTPVLNADEARELLDSIKIAKKTEDEEGAETEEPALVGLRDRALIGAMVYTFARINAVLQMKVC